MEELYQFDQEDRDSIATVDEKGKRIWIYPKKPSGRFHNLRIVVSIVLQIALVPILVVDPILPDIVFGQDPGRDRVRPIPS